MRSQDIFRQNLRHLMAGLGLKVKDLADMVGLSPSYLSLVLSGERQNLSDYHKDAIALALGTTVAALYTEGAFGPLEDEGAFQGGEEAQGATPGRRTGTGGELPPTGLPPPVRGFPTGRKRPLAQEFQPARVLPHTRVVPPAGMRGPSRDIGAFEDLLKALNVKDDLFLAAYYKELNALSDDDVRRFGEVIRRVLASWHENLAKRSGSDEIIPEYVSRAGFHILSAEDRILTALVAWLSPVLGEVPLEVFEIACEWPRERAYRLAGALEAAGTVAVSTTQEGRVTVGLAAGVDARLAKGWIQPSLKEECMGRLALYLSSISEPEYEEGRPRQPGGDAATPFRGVGPDKVAQLFLESHDYKNARLWYERAAVHSLSAHSWRLAKEHLEVVILLDGILGTDPEERAHIYQMMANLCLNLGDIDEALMYQEHNIAYWESAGRRADVTMGLLRASSMLARLRDWGKAKECLERALRISSGDLVLQARARIGLASILSSTGALKAASEELQKALDIGTRLNEPLIIVQSLLGLGRVHLAREDSRRASVALNQALSLAERQDPVARIWVGIELGRLSMLEGDLEKARQELATVADLAKEGGNLAEEHLARSYLSACFSSTPDPAELREAWAQAEAACRFFEGKGDSRGLVVALVACGVLREALGDDAAATGFFERAAREGRESEDPILEAFACRAFGEYLERLGDELAPVMLQRARWARARLK